MTKIVLDLAGVPETMLWTLHNRAAEALRPDGALRDPEAVRIYQAIAYDFERHFGKPEGAHAVRAAAFDQIVRRWLEAHPNGMVVSLGEGLETQAMRVDNGTMRWLSVDVPEAIGVRARFLPETGRFRHLAVSALDPAWMDAVDPSGGVLVLAQGLLMYFEPEDVTHLLGGIAHRFPGAEIVFDTVPVWFSRLTLKGLNRTPDYRLPPMPWGIDRDRIVPTMRAWVPAMNVEILPLPMSRGLARVIDQVFGVVPWLRHKRPDLVCCRVGL